MGWLKQAGRVAPLTGYFFTLCAACHASSRGAEREAAEAHTVAGEEA